MKNLNLKRIILEVFPLLLLSLIPLLWYQSSNSLALGHDMGYPINPVTHFLDRVYTWTNRFGLGDDQQIAVGGFFLHGIEALLYNFGLSVFTTQKIVFIFWTFAPIIGMYVLLRFLFYKNEDWFIRIFGSIFYGINHFLLQGWSIAERTKFSIAVCLPVVIYFYLSYQYKQKNAILTVFAIALTIFFFNGGGTPPLFGSLIVFFIAAAIYFFRKNNFWAQLKFHGLLVLITFLINSYWVFPLIGTYTNAYSNKLSEAGGIDGISAWVDTISKNTTYVNLLRLQGIPDWYDNPIHPYSNLFLNNVPLVVISFLIPLLFILAYIFSKKEERDFKTVVFFGLIGLLAILFAAGSSEPFGEIYKFLITHVPGLAVFRTPFYKFGLLMWMSFAVVVSYSINYLLKQVSGNATYLKVFLGSLVIIGYLSYNFPYFNGNFFNFMNRPYSTMTNFPEYVLEAGKYIDGLNKGRVLSLPDQEWYMSADQYNWGYWSTTPITALLTGKGVIANDHSKDGDHKLILQSIYSSFLNEDWNNFYHLTSKLNVSYILLREDYYHPTQSLSEYVRVVESNRDKFSLLKDYDKWKIYEIEQMDDFDYLVNEEEVEIYNSESLSPIMGLGPVIKNYIWDNFKKPTVKSISCEGCAKDYYLWSYDSAPENYWPGTYFFQFVKRREDTKLEANLNVYEKINFLSNLSLKRLREIGFMLNTNDSNERKFNIATDLYTSQIDRLTSLVNNINPENRSDIDNNNRSLIALQNNLGVLYSIMPRIYKNSYSYNNLQENITVLNQLISKLEKYKFISDDNKLRFVVDNLEAGRYGVFFDSNGFEEFIGRSKYSLLLNGKPTETKTAKKIFESQYLGDFDLGGGLNYLEFDITNDRNIIDKNSREFSVVSRNGVENCFEYEVSHLTGSEYRLTFEQKVEKGSPLWFMFVTGSEDKYQKSEAVPSNTVGWTETRYDLYPDVSTKKATIKLCLKSGDHTESISLIRNFKMVEQISPTLTFVKSKTNEEINKQVTEIEVNRVSNVLYKMRIKKSNNSSEYITIPETYNSSWEIIGNQTIEQTHSTMNGYANVWQIDNPGDYNLSIYYKPQDLYKAGWIVSTFAIFGTIFLVLVMKKRND